MKIKKITSQDIEAISWAELLERLDFNYDGSGFEAGKKVSSWSKYFDEEKVRINIVEFKEYVQAMIVEPFTFEVFTKEDFLKIFAFAGQERLYEATFLTPKPGKTGIRGIVERFGAKMADRLRELTPIERFENDEIYAAKVKAARDELSVKEYAKYLEQEKLHERSRPTPRPKSMKELMEEPPRYENWLVQDLMAFGWTVFLVAAAKVGKTTLMSNLVKSLYSGTPFLGRFETKRLDRKIGILNFELTDDQLRDWLQDVGIDKTEQIIVWGLRGEPNPFRSNAAKEEFIEMLRKEDIGFLIIDPFSKAYSGDSMSNDEVKNWLLELEQVKTAASVDNLFLLVHAGRDGSKSRGASALDDHPDAIWYVQRDDSSQRFFRAIGRDVDVPEEALSYSVDTRIMTLSGSGRKAIASLKIEEHILDFVRKNPNCTASQIDAEIVGNNAKIANARKQLLKSGRLIESSGPHNSKRYVVNVSFKPEPFSDQFSLGTLISSSSSPLYTKGENYIDWPICPDCGRFLAEEDLAHEDFFVCPSCESISLGEIISISLVS